MTIDNLNDSPAWRDGVAPLTVVGIDPGLTRCGVGVVRGTGAAMVHVAHTTIRTSNRLALPARLDVVFSAVGELLTTHDPDIVAVERVLFSRNVRTAMATGQAAGTALLAAQRHGVEVIEVTPTAVKLAVAGDGAADKQGVARMVALQLGLAALPQPADAADALAVAMAAILHQGPTAGPTSRNTGAGNITGGWQAHLEDRGLNVIGGTSASQSRRAGR